MKHFKMKDGPFIYSKDSVCSMMKRLIFAFVPILMLYFYQYGIVPFYSHNFGVFVLFCPFIFVMIPAFVYYGVDLFFARFIFQKKDNDLKYHMKHSSYFMYGIVLGLIIPVHTSIILMVIGSFVGAFCGKVIYCGFNRYVFHPSLIGQVFIFTFYSIMSQFYNEYLSFYESNFIIFSLFYLFLFFYLAFTKTIKWKIPVFYIGIVCLMSFMVGLYQGVNLFVQIMSRGLFIGAVFVVTDSLVSPVTSFGQVIYGIVLGILTVCLHCFVPYMECVFTSILIMNLFVSVIDKMGNWAKFNRDIIGVSSLVLIFTIGVITCIIGV